VYADTTFKTVALDTHDNAAVFVTDAPAKHTQVICPLSRQVSHFLILSHRLSLSTISTDMRTTECKHTGIHSVLPNKVLSMQPTRTNFIPQFLSVSIILHTHCICCMVISYAYVPSLKKGKQAKNMSMITDIQIHNMAKDVCLQKNEINKKRKYVNSHCSTKIHHNIYSKICNTV
jgi:hypothetical protein